jgi:hypothetical protein
MEGRAKETCIWKSRRKQLKSQLDELDMKSNWFLG